MRGGERRRRRRRGGAGRRRGEESPEDIGKYLEAALDGDPPREEGEPLADALTHLGARPCFLDPVGVVMHPHVDVMRQLGEARGGSVRGVE